MTRLIVGSTRRASDARWRETSFFLSYSHADHRAATRIRRFLQEFELPRGEDGQRHRLRAYRDVENLRAGKLEDELRSALAGSDALVVCCSPHARDSRWVTRELEWFRERGKDRSIFAALLGGDEESSRQPGLGDGDRYYADLRQGWLLGRPRSKTRLELIRIVAGITGLDLKQLIDLDRQRRIRRRVTLTVMLAAVLGVAAMYPVTRWEALPLPESVRQPVVAAEVIDGDLVIGTRLRSNDVERSRNYLRLHPSTGEPWWFDDENHKYDPRHRLIPIQALDYQVVRSVLQELGIDPGRRPVLWLGKPDASTYIALRRLEDESATALSHEHFTAGSEIYLRRDGKTLPPFRIDLYPQPPALEGSRSMSPADGLPVARLPSGLWLGAMRRPDGRGLGGLWHLAPDVTTWRKIEGFASVNSIAGLSDDPHKVLVAESYRALDPAAAESPRGTRLMVVDSRDYSAAPYDGPPFDTTSEVEIAGIDPDHGLVIRVAQTVFSRQTRPLWERLAR